MGRVVHASDNFNRSGLQLEIINKVERHGDAKACYRYDRTYLRVMMCGKLSGLGSGFDGP